MGSQCHLLRCVLAVRKVIPAYFGQETEGRVFGCKKAVVVPSLDRQALPIPRPEADATEWRMTQRSATAVRGSEYYCGSCIGDGEDLLCLQRKRRSAGKHALSSVASPLQGTQVMQVSCWMHATHLPLKTNESMASRSTSPPSSGQVPDYFYNRTNTVGKSLKPCPSPAGPQAQRMAAWPCRPITLLDGHALLTRPPRCWCCMHSRWESHDCTGGTMRRRLWSCIR